MALIDKVIHRKGVHEPLAHASSLHIVRVLDVVEVASSFVAFDVYVEHLLDRLSVVVECAKW